MHAQYIWLWIGGVIGVLTMGAFALYWQGNKYTGACSWPWPWLFLFWQLRLSSI